MLNITGVVEDFASWTVAATCVTLTDDAVGLFDVIVAKVVGASAPEVDCAAPVMKVGSLVAM